MRGRVTQKRLRDSWSRGLLEPLLFGDMMADGNHGQMAR